MRIVLDTNVLVSGLLNPHGAPGRIVEAMLSETFMALYDDRMLSEYAEVLQRPDFGLRRSDVEILLEFVETAGERISALPAALVLPDAGDLPFLEVAISGKADALVTGNLKHFKPRRGQHKIQIVAPSDFLRRYLQ